MTATGVNSPLAPTPVLPSKSYSSTPVQQFSSALRPPVSTTPTRDGRSRSAATVNPTQAVTHENFHDVMTRRFISALDEANSRVSDPLYSDHLARLNRIQTSMSQHVTTLKDYSRQLSELDTRQQSLMKDLRDAKDTLEKESQEILNAAIPEITEQTKTMENVETRVETARTKLAHQVDTLADIDFKIAENRRLMALPPPSSRHIISAPPLHSREASAESTSSEKSQPNEPSTAGWSCTIS